jgi:group I intron endonuclease
LTAFLGYIHSLKGYNLSSNLKFKSFSTKNSNSNSNKPLAIKIYDNIHTIETQLKIKKDNNQKSGIYCIINKINGKMYIGSAITNRINTRFRNHCINLTGSIPVKNAINKYGLSNFKFLILEYYPGIIKKENLKKSHIKLIELETYYITIYKPLYNILPYAYSSLGYKHKPETIENLKLNYSEERKLNIGNLNRNKIFTEEEKLKLRNLMLKKYATQPNLKLRLSQAASKPVI